MIEFFFTGILTGQLLQKLHGTNISLLSLVLETKLSPSFYTPSNLLILGDDEFTELASQFNSVSAWSLLPKYEKRCFKYFQQKRPKHEYLYFAKCLLERGNHEGTRILLKSTLSFNWPETHR